MRRAAIFDLDGTLIQLPSSERRFIGELWAQRLINWRRGLLFGLFLVAWLPRFGSDVARKNKAYLSGLRVEDMEAMGQTFAQALRRNISPRLQQALKDHQQAGDHTLLLTGSPYFIAEPLGQLLGFDEISGTRLAVSDEYFSWLPPTEHPLGEDKVRLARAFCQAHGLRLRDAAAYGDSKFDLPLLNAVKDPVAVAPDATLEATAAAQGWEIISKH